MTEDKLQKLIEVLLEKTKRNMVLWKVTNRGSEYTLLLQHGRITIDYFRSGSEDQWFYDFVIYNANGSQIESLLIDEDDDTDLGKFLSSLYKEAKRQFLKVEETLDGMLDEISKDDVVGTNFDPDEEIPF